LEEETEQMVEPSAGTDLCLRELIHFFSDDMLIGFFCGLKCIRSYIGMDIGQ